MVRSAIFTNRFGRAMRCELGAPGRTCMAIKSISGLGPGDATVNVHDIATIDGGYVGSVRYGPRHIGINIKFLDCNEDGQYVPVEHTRHVAYSFFQPKTSIQVIIEADERTLLIVGVIETCDPDIFSKDSGINISIVCPGYYFKNAKIPEGRLFSRIYSNGLFEFPFSNESLTRKLLEFGSAQSSQKKTVYYDGDAENGMVTEIVFNGNTVSGDITMYLTPKGNPDADHIGFSEDIPEYVTWSDRSLVENYISINISTLHDLLASRYSDPIYTKDNKIVISSETGSKTAKFITSTGTSYNILGYLSHLDWLKIYPGLNEFVVSTNAESIGNFAVGVDYEVLYTGI